MIRIGESGGSKSLLVGEIKLGLKEICSETGLLLGHLHVHGLVGLHTDNQLVGLCFLGQSKLTKLREREMIP